MWGGLSSLPVRGTFESPMRDRGQEDELTHKATDLPPSRARVRTGMSAEPADKNVCPWSLDIMKRAIWRGWQDSSHAAAVPTMT